MLEDIKNMNIHYLVGELFLFKDGNMEKIDLSYSEKILTDQVRDSDNALLSKSDFEDDLSSSSQFLEIYQKYINDGYAVVLKKKPFRKKLLDVNETNTKAHSRIETYRKLCSDKGIDFDLLLKENNYDTVGELGKEVFDYFMEDTVCAARVNENHINVGLPLNMSLEDANNVNKFIDELEKEPFWNINLYNYYMAEFGLDYDYVNKMGMDQEGEVSLWEKSMYFLKEKTSTLTLPMKEMMKKYREFDLNRLLVDETLEALPINNRNTGTIMISDKEEYRKCNQKGQHSGSIDYLNKNKFGIDNSSE